MSKKLFRTIPSVRRQLLHGCVSQPGGDPGILVRALMGFRGPILWQAWSCQIRLGSIHKVDGLSEQTYDGLGSRLGSPLFVSTVQDIYTENSKKAPV